ncbi:MAG: glycosyltransferase [Candidatus Parcubacteria bacterium]|nr:glycosyltransferase [Burkholderiales bacterium]
MEAAPLVSVAMAMRDAERSLPMALASLFAQTHARWELLLVDDGSRDASLLVAQRFADPRVRLLADGVRKGLGARLNEAVQLARGELVARMDADDVCYPERFERQLEFLLAHPEVDLLGSAMVVFAGEGEPTGMFKVKPAHDQICARPWAGFRLPHPTWMGRKAWFRRHPYDPSAMKGQDQGLLVRTYKLSRFAALPEPLLGYRQDALELRKVLAGRYHFTRALVGDAPSLAWRGVPGQIAKAAYDTLAISSGMERRLLAHRARPLSGVDAMKWREVWQRMAREAAQRCAA